MPDDSTMLEEGKGIAAAAAETAAQKSAESASAGADDGGTGPWVNPNHAVKQQDPDPEWLQIQKETFLRWVYLQLDVDADGDGEIDEDKKDQALSIEEIFKTGTNLVKVIEKHSDKRMPRGTYSNPKLKVQQLDNLAQCFRFLETLGIRLVNISNEDIWNGNGKLICGLIWTLIYEFQLKAGKEELLKWIQEKIPEAGITNFNNDWRDGKNLCALTNALGREVYGDSETLIGSTTGDALADSTTGADAAHKKLGVAKVLTPKMMVNPACDDRSMIAYLTQFRSAHQPEEDKAEAAAREKARLAAEAERVAAEEAAKLADAEAARLAAEAAAAEEERKRLEAEAAAAEEERLRLEAEAAAAKAAELPPPMERAADWREYHGIDLGGRCRIRVYYSTTTSDHKIRSNTFDLQRLLEIKKVHLRPDFEPWIPVDMDMDREFRNKIFEKAGTRKTPLLFVDDEFVGGYDEVNELNEIEELDKILAY